MAHIKVIKRYENRKLYDTGESRYVTLEDIAHLLRANQDVKVVDNKTGDDLTSITLAQILFEEEKKRKSLLPLVTFKRIIQYGGESLQDLFERIFSLGPEAGEQIMGVLRGRKARARRLVTEALSATVQGIDDIQRRLDKKMAEALEKIMIVPRLVSRLKALEKRVVDLEKQIRRLKAPLG